MKGNLSDTPVLLTYDTHLEQSVSCGMFTMPLLTMFPFPYILQLNSVTRVLDRKDRFCVSLIFSSYLPATVTLSLTLFTVIKNMK